MAFYMKPGQGPKMKTGNGLPSGLMGGPKMKPCGGPMMHEGDGKEHAQPAKQARHPGFDQSYYGKGFQAAQSDSSGVANVLNEREYDEGKKRQEAYENTNPFPTQGQELKGRLKKYKVKSIDSKTGDYVINKIGGFSNENNRNVTRREMQQSLRHNTYEVPNR